MTNYFLAMPEESDRTENDVLSRLLEVELAQRRAEWARVREQRQRLRAFSFAFVSVIVLGALTIFYFFFGRAHELRDLHRPTPTTSP